MTSTPKRVVLYARVSTEGQSADLQLNAMRQVVERRGWQIVGEFTDSAVSGSKDRRPELDKLMKLVHRGGVDVVLVWKFDRFARSIRHLVMALDDFRAMNVDFTSLDDAIDTTTPLGRFAFHIFGAVAEYERELIRERSIAGVAEARRKGKRIGRPPVYAPLWKIRMLRKEGKSIREIGRLLKISHSTIHRLVHMDGAEDGDVVSPNKGSAGS